MAFRVSEMNIGMCMCMGMMMPMCTMSRAQKRFRLSAQHLPETGRTVRRL